MCEISIIVPVYKVEKYLKKCVDSILAQTFSDFELILVDDGSPDNSGRICDDYAKKDARVRVVHKQNGGLSSARNAGIEVAKGNIWALLTVTTISQKICMNFYIKQSSKKRQTYRSVVFMMSTREKIR